jgi:membrane protein involved in colicin uptake
MSRERLPIATDAEDKAAADRQAAEVRAHHDAAMAEKTEEKKKGGLLGGMDMGDMAGMAEMFGGGE